MRIERVLANNPGPYTGPGTNTWLVDDGGGAVAVIDPGPIDSAHLDRVLLQLKDRRPVAVLVTHTHPDHAPLANPLAKELAVPAYGHSQGPDFVPDLMLVDGSALEVGVVRLDVIHTPGHASDHLCFRVDDVLFTGDHIMGGSSVMVEDMGSYLGSLERLSGTGLTRLHPGHGDEMEDPDLVIDWYLAHRLQRHEEIYEAVLAGVSSVPAIVEKVYAEVSSSLHPLAAKSVEAHLALLRDQGRIALSQDRAFPVLPDDS